MVVGVGIQTTMSTQNTLTQESIGADQEETFAFAPIADAGRVNIANLSYGEEEAAEHTYTVSVDDRGHATTSCTCPPDTYYSGKCKHREAVEENREVLAAAAPDVREADGDSLADDVTRALARSFTLGVDSEGRTHHYYRPADTVVVFTESSVEYRQYLGGRSLGEWTGFVAADCGWRHRGRLAGLADHVDAEREQEGSL